MTYRVVLLVADSDLATSLHVRFQEMADYAVIGSETTSGDLYAFVGSDPDIDAVLIHDGIESPSLMEVTRELIQRQPHVAVIWLSSYAGNEILAEAMEAGARGVLSQDASVEELTSRIAIAADWSRTMRRRMDSPGENPMGGQRGTVVSVVGAKGGTGSTTLAVHLAMATVAARRSVCLVDLDLQTGDIPTYLDVTHRRSMVDLVEVADSIDAAILADTIYVHPAGLHVLLAPEEGERGEDVNARVIRQVLGTLRTRYEVVIVDCGSYMTDATAMAVEAADKVLVTATPDLPALRAAKRIAKMWVRLQVRKEDELNLVLVKQNRRNEIQPDFAAKISGLSLLRATVPATFRSLETAANTGSPSDVDDNEFRRSVGQVAMEIGLVNGGSPKGRASPKKRVRDDSGNLFIEFLGIWPLILFIALVMWQMVMIGMTQMYASHAATEAARNAAVLGESPKWCPQPKKPPVICSTWQTIKDRSLARISTPWDDKNTFYLRLTGTNNYAVTGVRVPMVLPGLQSPWQLNARAKIVSERDGSS
ncbi:MAG TPA: AAA family ATPase [Streptosporangiaceae bacterium]|jgi:pilus assembly protein CpaE